MIDLSEVGRANTDLTPEMAEMLRGGAAHDLGIVCRPGQVRKLWPLLLEAVRLKLVALLDVERPIITEAGRLAIGAPTQAEADRARLVALCSRRKPLQPPRDEDPRTDSDYRSYQSMGSVCTLVMRLPDPRINPQSILVGATLDSSPQRLGPRNSIVQPESEGTRFVLAVVPKWMTKPRRRRNSELIAYDPAIFSSSPCAIDEDDARFTEDERATWDRLRNVCMSINVRIRSGGKRKSTIRLLYGEYA